MSWTYEISTGRLYDDSRALVGVGYSGKGQYKNDANSQSLHDLGPIVEGTYRISPPVDTSTHGPYVLPLTPEPENQMHGRSGFLIHGDSLANPGTASEGCIIMPRNVREQVWASNDHTLDVVDLLAEEPA